MHEFQLDFKIWIYKKIVLKKYDCEKNIYRPYVRK